MNRPSISAMPLRHRGSAEARFASALRDGRRAEKSAPATSAATRPGSALIWASLKRNKL
jgi:hypothetical protein